MDDHRAIQRLLDAYSYTGSRKAFDETIALFAEDGVWDLPDLSLRFAGHVAVRAAFDTIIGPFEYLLQLNAPGRIDIDGDTATAHSSIRESGKYADRGEALEVLGFYHDRIVRTANGWKFAERRFEVLGMHHYAVSPVG